jgi:glycosyltransferase involved in cell wall biosynthesis
MSVYNDERFVGEAVGSILSQSYPDFELLVVDDGSTDRSREIVRSFPDPRIRLVENPENMGLTRSLNRGLSLAGGELVARMDSNDVSHPRRFEKQVAFLDRNPGVAVVGTRACYVSTSGRRFRHPAGWKPATPLGIRWYFMFDSPVNHTSSMYRTGIVRDRFGGYDETFRVAQDADLWLRIAGSHEVANLPEVLLDQRIDPAGLSFDAASPRRAGHAERWEALVRTAMARYLESDDIPADWASRWVGLNGPGRAGEGDDPLAYLPVLDAMMARFGEVNPGAGRDPDVRHYLAALQARIACRLAESRRPGALRAYSRALRTDPASAGAWGAKLFGLLFLGEAARRAVNAMRRR